MPRTLNQANDFAKRYNLPIFALEDLQCEKNDDGVWKKKIHFHGVKEDGYMWGFPIDQFTNGRALYKKRGDHCFAVKTGLVSRVITLDFDTEDYYHQTIDHLANEYDEDGEKNFLYCPEIKNTLTIKSRKGFHVYLRISSDKTMFSNSTNVWDAPLDIRGEGGCSLCPPTSYEFGDDEFEYHIHNEHEIATMSNVLYEFLSNAKNVKLHGKNYTDEISGNGIVRDESKKATTDLGRLTELVNLLPDDYCANYTNWFNIGAIINTETNASEDGLNLWMEVSRKAKGYETTPERVYAEKWREFLPGKISIGSLIYILRELGITIPYQQPTEWMGFESEEEDEGFSSIELMKRQRTIPMTDELLAIMSKKPKEQTPEEKKMMDDFYNGRYKRMKKYFEKYHFFNLETECIVRVNPEGNLKFIKNHKLVFADCVMDYKEKNNGFVDWWLRDMYKRNYDKIDFYPPPAICPRNVYNSFTPFVIEKTPSPEDDGECPEILEHIGSLVDYHEPSIKYFLCFLAHLVQKPGEIPGVAIVLISDEGIGKGSFMRKIIHILLGRRYGLETEKIGDIVGRFNSSIRDKLVVCKDEMNGKDGFESVEALKHLITEPTINCEKKGVDTEEVHNYIRLFFFSNNDIPIKISADDRRYVVFRGNGKYIHNPQYFKNLHKKLDDKVYMRRFYDILMSMDIRDWNPMADRPKTEVYKEIQQAYIPPIQRFMREYLEEHTWSDTDSTGGTDNERVMILEITPTHLYDKFKRWCDRTRIGLGRDGHAVISQAKFGRDLKKMKGIWMERSSRQRIYKINPVEALEELPVLD